MGGRGSQYTDVGVMVDMAGGSGSDKSRSIPVAGLTPSSNGTSLRYTSVSATLSSLEKNALKLDHEQLKIIDKDGFVIHAVDGNKGSVGFAGGESKVKGNVVTHNHPRDDSKMNGGTFSEGDISSLSMGMSEMRASAREGTYSLKAGRKANPTGFYNSLVSSSTKTELNKKMLVAGRKVNPKNYSSKTDYHTAVFNAQLKVYHNWYKANASKYGYTYTFTKNS